MKRTAFVLTLFTSIALLRAAPPPAGFTALFNGRDLSGWRGGTTFDHRKLLAMSEAERTAQIAKWTATMTEVNPATSKAHWHVEGDELVNDGKGAYASTLKDYGNFELRLDYKTVAGADSGIYLRGVPQVQIWDINQPDQAKRPDRRPRLGSGGLFNNAAGSPGRDPLVAADKPFGQWNQVRVVMVGSRVSVWLNEKLVVDHALMQNFYEQKLPATERRPVPARGPIQLQTHGGEIRWRNINLRDIGTDEVNRILASHGGQGYQRIFNGKNLDGWAGALESVAVQNGTMVWQKGKAGVPYWNKELGDFKVRLMVKLPPGGNNGLAIRYPGKGNAAYDGMTELQILDENYNEVKKLPPQKQIDSRQYYGSVYGMIAAARGYQHPIGEWNFEEVTVKGPRIVVELNGTVILDGDVSKVDMANVMGRKAHPGKDRPRGYFGFAGHNEPVEFKDVFIKEL
ncbi:MAG: DUF1080 domain-containing protein [Opitutaceae bacterium]|nr:DUF1080 domain-containing protein [Opitutaceae bacterium]